MTETTDVSTEMSRIKEVRLFIESDQAIEQIKRALPAGSLTADRLLRVAITGMQRNPKLLECTKISMLGALVESAQLGLEPQGAFGEAYIVPYKNSTTKAMEAQLQIGYKGLMKCALNSGKVTAITGEVVYQRDEFKEIKGTEPSITHVPYDEDENAGDLVAAYAVAQMRDAPPMFKVLRVHEIHKLRARSKAAKSGPWITDYNAMCVKSAIRQLCKFLPLRSEDQNAIARDENRDFDIDGVIDIPASEVSPGDGSLDGLEESLEDSFARNEREEQQQE